MKNSHTSSGWLSLRFWAISFAFWVLYAVLSLSAAYLAFRDQAVDSWPTLWMQAWPLGAYWLVTPPLFECAYRLGRSGLGARRYFLRLAAVVLLAGAAQAVLYVFAYAGGTDIWETVWSVAAISPAWVFHDAAILGCAVAINQFRFAQLRQQELLSAQLRALRSQLQPHFLFNALQAIAATIKRDGDAAIGMLTLLGDLLRQTLQERDEGLVALAEEQQLLEPYLELQRLRFADRLQVEVDIPAHVLGAAVPDLILQPLVENALQHGIESQPGKGTIRIRARRSGDYLELEVADDGAGPDREQIVDGIGLGATRARLQALFGDRAELRLWPGSQSGTVVCVRLPWQEVSVAA